MSKKPLVDYPIEQLLEELDAAIRINHYDATDTMINTPYSIEKYKLEILNRFEDLHSSRR